MNQAHKLGKLKNRLNRLFNKKQHPDTSIEQKERIAPRIKEIESLLK